MNKRVATSWDPILVINTTKRDQTEIALISNRRGDRLIAPLRAQELQKLIEQLLRRHHLTVGDLRAVAVLQGPGSFTGLRIGLTAANVLAWLRHLPVVEIPGSDLEVAIEGLLENRDYPVSKRTRPKQAG